MSRAFVNLIEMRSRLRRVLDAPRHTLRILCRRNMCVRGSTHFSRKSHYCARFIGIFTYLRSDLFASYHSATNMLLLLRKAHRFTQIPDTTICLTFQFCFPESKDHDESVFHGLKMPFVSLHGKLKTIN